MAELDNQHTAGYPGEPGEPADGGHGGAGGKGGEGGAGDPQGEGGSGGPGGGGGQGAKGDPGNTGEKGERGPRGPRQNEGKSYWTQTGVIPRWQLFAVYAVVVAAFFISNARVSTVAHRADRTSQANQALALQVAQEARARVNESCVQTETRYANAVTSLGNTYKYIVTLTPAERKTTLNRFIITALPKQESDLKGLRPPKFCDAKGVGLPSPLPTIPKRPKGV